MAIALLIEDAERALTVVHSIHDTREAWMDGYETKDIPSNSPVKVGWIVSANGTIVEPTPVEPPSQPAMTYKADIYRRCTDAEAEAIEMALAAAPVRERRLFESAQYLDHAAPEFVSMQTAMTEMFGASRTAALLAAS